MDVTTMAIVGAAFFAIVFISGIVAALTLLLSRFAAKRRPEIDWGCACGRTYLKVDGYVVAMEGDPLRDVELTAKVLELHKEDNEFHEKQGWAPCYDGRVWTGKLIKWLARKLTGNPTL